MCFGVPAGCFFFFFCAEAHFTSAKHASCYSRMPFFANTTFQLVAPNQTFCCTYKNGWKMAGFCEYLWAVIASTATVRRALDLQQCEEYTEEHLTWDEVFIVDVRAGHWWPRWIDIIAKHCLHSFCPFFCIQQVTGDLKKFSSQTFGARISSTPLQHVWLHSVCAGLGWC